MSNALRRLALLAHGVVIAALFSVVAQTAAAWPWRAGVFTVLAAPLAIAATGLVRRSRYTCQWLAILLVVYIGAAAVEVVAHGGTNVPSSVLLLAAVLELGCLLALTRSARPRAPRE